MRKITATVLLFRQRGTNDVVQNYDLPNAPQRLSNLISQITSYSVEIYVMVAQIITSTNASDAAQIPLGTILYRSVPFGYRFCAFIGFISFKNPI
jgi:hypothetical protein